MSAFTEATLKGSFLPNSQVTSQTKLYTGSMLSPLDDGVVYEVKPGKSKVDIHYYSDTETLTLVINARIFLFYLKI